MSPLLSLMRLASPALPVGGFSYSEGLEAAVDAGLVCDEASAGRWLVHQMQISQQRADLPLMAAAFMAWNPEDKPRITALNDWVMQTRETRELRLQTEQMGRSLTDWLRQRWPDDPRIGTLRALLPAPSWPVAFALAGVHTEATLHEVLLCCGFAWAENMVQGALKAVPLGQSAGQRLLDTLTEALPEVARHAEELAGQSDSARQSYAPRLAILSARHEAQYSRLFRS